MIIFSIRERRVKRSGKSAATGESAYDFDPRVVNLTGKRPKRAENESLRSPFRAERNAAMYEGSIKISLPANLAEVERLNRVVRQFGELHEIPGRTLYAVNLALDEIVTNIILHGYEPGQTEPITVQMEAADGELRSEVRDGGRAFNPLDAPLPDLTGPLEKRTLGGLGIHLVRSLMDTVDYQLDGTKNVLSIRKRIR
jgi:serine/threonine-protein kinase RsbW